MPPGRQNDELARARRALAVHEERLRILREIDAAIVAQHPPEAIAAAVIQPLRALLGVPRAIVNVFDLAAGEAEWVAAAGRRRTRVGPGVRYPIELMGDLQALRRGEAQRIDARLLPRNAHSQALLASGIRVYLAAPMIAGGELIGALSFGGAEELSAEQAAIAHEAATQLAIAIAQARLRERLSLQARELERRVAERTAELDAANRELEAANQELESFSYSVSHDLRAPLRAVDGFTRILEQDYAVRLDDEGRRLLGVVRASSRQMGQLIDDLLAFSRLSRQPLARLRIDMNALAAEVIGGLAREAPAKIELAALPGAEADPSLLRQVWTNLLDNALKYSGKREAARIEIGAREEALETVYWVRDNGAGFDMRYAGKLFGVFQRLHTADEFPGTGVGLAIVQRVVARHGGRVWAQARPGEGACFYFSLPKRTVG